MTKDPNRVSDGFLSLEGGMDSGFSPSLIQANEVSFAVNTTFRGGWPAPRPGWRKVAVDFAGSSGSQGAYFQGAGSFIDRAGDSRLVYSMGGRLWSINLNEGNELLEFTPSQRNNSQNTHAWFQEAENAIVVQDNEAKPVIWDGLASRRAGADEVPIGGPMAYGKGRLWVARSNSYVGGDLVYSTSAGRDSIFKFTENTFIAEGGSFSVPGGGITGMAFGANLDTSLGDGDLLVYTFDGVFAFSAPVDRTTWKDLTYPIQRYAQLDFGAVNHESIVRVNGDLLCRAPDGIRSLIYARRDFSEWGNTPISRQVRRVLKYDSESLLSEASSVNFDNRLLMTTQPQLDRQYGVWHRGVVALDYDLVSGMGRKFAPAWEGAWTGLKIMRLVVARVNSVLRCFAFVLGDAGALELWELSKNDLTDNDGRTLVPITWILETRSMACASPGSVKDLIGADLWYDQLAGDVQMTVRYRRDNSQLWWTWGSFSDSAEFFACAPVEYPSCQTIRYWVKQTRTRVGLPQPRACPDAENGGNSTSGYEFQLRFEIRGHLRLKRLILNCNITPQPLFTPVGTFTCAPCDRNYCNDGDAALQACDLPDYNYQAKTLFVLGTETQPIITDGGAFILTD